MIVGFVVVLLLAAAGAAFIAAPLLRADAAEAERVVAAASEEVDLQSQHNMVLAALKDLEEDRATDKVDDADYHELHARLTAQAVGIMKRLDELELSRRRSAPQGRGATPAPTDA